MFAFHETTRRLLCRAAFVFAVMLPTCVTVSWLGYRLTPFYSARQKAIWEQQLVARLGFHVTIDRVAYPRFDSVQIHRLNLVDPETKAEVASARLIEAAPTERGWVLLISGAEVPTAHCRSLWDMVSQRLLREIAGPETRWEVIIPTLALKEEERPQTLNDVQLVAENLTNESRASLEFRVAGLDMAQPAQVRLIRNRQTSPGLIGWELNSQSASLPTSLFAPFWPALKKLGDDSRFAGLMKFRDSPTGWQGEISGTWRHVDLSRLIREQLSQGKLSGLAEISVKHLRLENGRVSEAAGILKSHSGVIGRPLLEAVARPETLQLSLSDSVRESTENNWTYREFALGFRIDRTGLELSGNCQHSPGVIMNDVRGPLVSESGKGPVPALALLRALVPSDDLQVPAAKETLALINLLPLPTSVPTGSTTTARPPTSPPLRLNHLR